MTEAVKTLKDWIDHSENIVFFGGARSEERRVGKEC